MSSNEDKSCIKHMALCAGFDFSIILNSVTHFVHIREAISHTEFFASQIISLAVLSIIRP